MTPDRDSFIVYRTLLAAPLLLLAACASGGGAESMDELRSETVRSTNQVPDEVTEMRETLAERRAETNERLDSVMGGAPEGGTGHWYSPVFDVLDAAVSAGKWLY